MHGTNTDGWMEGQVELRALPDQEGRYEDWKILIVLADLGDENIIVAVDDFTFRYLINYKL
jgi:hypothetical protein